MMSDFWKRVDEEIEYKGINRAFLARKCDFSVTNIGQGIKLGSTPSAETAVKIATVLGVSVEYLVTGENQSQTKKEENEQNQLKLYRKYQNLISKCEKLPDNQIDFLGQVADRLEK